MKKLPMNLSWFLVCGALPFMAACQSNATKEVSQPPQAVEEEASPSEEEEEAPAPTYCTPEQVEQGNCENEVAAEPAQESEQAPVAEGSEAPSAPVAVQEESQAAPAAPIAVETVQEAIPAAPVAEHVPASEEALQEVAAAPLEAQEKILEALLIEEAATAGSP